MQYYNFCCDVSQPYSIASYFVRVLFSLDLINRMAIFFVLPPQLPFGVAASLQKVLAPVTVLEGADAHTVRGRRVDKHAVVEVDAYVGGLAVAVDEENKVAFLQL